MRVIAVACLLTAPMIALGWPSPWLLLAGSFAAGFVARRPLTPGRAPRRPGYLLPPASRPGNQGTVERVETYTGFSTAGQSPEGTAPPVTPAEPSSFGALGDSTNGRAVPSGMDGYLGRVLVSGVGSNTFDRYQAYIDRLTDGQRSVMNALREETIRTGALPVYALEVMERFGPWPDPYDDADTDG